MFYKSVTVIALIIMVGMAFTTKEGTDDPSLARVSKVQGKYVFVMCEPMREYDFLDSKNSGFRAAMMGGNRDIDEQMRTMISKGLKAVEDEKMEDFDAVYSSDGVDTSYIKFKE